METIEKQQFDMLRELLLRYGSEHKQKALDELYKKYNIASLEDIQQKDYAAIAEYLNEDGKQCEQDYIDQRGYCAFFADCAEQALKHAENDPDMTHLVMQLIRFRQMSVASANSIYRMYIAKVHENTTLRRKIKALNKQIKNLKIKQG